MQLGRVAVQAGKQLSSDQRNLAPKKSLEAENAALKTQVNELLKEVIYYQRMYASLMEQQTKEEINTSEIYLRIA